jgi:formylglycine-generating enzyme required for sulfatase activity
MLAKVGNVADASFGTRFNHIREGFIKASDGYVFTSPVGSFKPNAFGLYDMHGNALQWCSDRYSAEYYATSPTNDPTGPDFGLKRVCRGSAWYCSPELARSANRSSNFPSYRLYGDVGFRVARTQ